MFIGRELSDPMGMFNDAAKPTTQGNPSRKKSAPNATKPKQGNIKATSQSIDSADIHPDIIANLIEQRIHQLYANWCDEPIPALGDQTPREAIKTAAGLERVKGLLRSYEESEELQAKEQGRRVISFAFLWSAVGLEPD